MDHSNYIGKTLKEFIDDLQDWEKGFYIVMTPYETLSLTELIEVLDVYDYLGKDKNKFLNLEIKSISDQSADCTYWIKTRRKK